MFYPVADEPASYHEQGGHHGEEGHGLHQAAGAGRVLKQASGIKSGSATVGKGTFVGQISRAQISEIAAKKMPDLNCATLEAASAMIEGSARSMGLEVVG